ncbi:MAG: FGGY family pentulose kinase [Granulosicoccus sp.]|nr:FGGY family pentulose kinase [Granulosicoccus sp.]
MGKFFIGVDVGTGSARAGLFDNSGHLHAKAQAPIALHRPESAWAEQSSTQIWQAVCQSVQECLNLAAIAGNDVNGISFSATCSLVLLDQQGEPLCLSEGEEQWDIICWMDHRATAQAEEISKSGSTVLNNLGGVMSPEMQIPKLMWLKKKRPDLWKQLGFAADLADFLTYRCSGSIDRSVCTLGCKWTYDADKQGWDKGFLADVGLSDLQERAQLPDTARTVGSSIGPLTDVAAKELGLGATCQVAIGLIDAHAGALGTLGVYAPQDIDRHMALIAGTSNCHIALSSIRREVPGVWGPYAGAVTANTWANEGGQSASGALLDHVVKLLSNAEPSDATHDDVTKQINERLSADPEFAYDVHVIPDILGNRSPFADASMKGAIMGLSLESAEETFLKVYWAAAASLAYGTRLIVDRLNAHGYHIDMIHLSGGHRKSELLLKLYADATGCEIVLSPSDEPVLSGAAVAAMLPFFAEKGLAGIADQFQGEHEIRQPDSTQRELHAKRYQSFIDYYAR